MFDLSSIFAIVFLPFSFEPVFYCAAFSFIIAVFGLIRRFIFSDYSFKR